MTITDNVKISNLVCFILNLNNIVVDYKLINDKVSSSDKKVGVEIIEEILSTYGLFAIKIELSATDLIKLPHPSKLILVNTNDSPFFVYRAGSILKKLRIFDGIKHSNFSSHKINEKSSFNCIVFEMNHLLKSTSFASTLFKYTSQFKGIYFQIFIGIFSVTAFQFISPFLMRLLIDKGISSKDIGLIKAILISLFVFSIGNLISTLIRNWLFLRIGTRVNISLISGFIHNIFKLPISVFSPSSIGDILQRIEDNKRIENFITKSLLLFISNIILLISFMIILFIFNKKIFIIFFVCSILLIIWMLVFWRIRERIDTNIFRQNSSVQNSLIQMIQGIQEIRLYNLESNQIAKWEDQQGSLYLLKKKLLQIDNIQSSGITIINDVKNYLILFIVSLCVVNGEFSFGTMISIQYILGQANSPLKSIAELIKELQSVLISFDRLNQMKKIETNQSLIGLNFPKKVEVKFNSISFSYRDTKKQFFLNNINLTIPNNCVTAIVGPSGSGKSTLLKLMSKLYLPYKGGIYIDGTNINGISEDSYRENTIFISPESILFKGSIIENIACGESVDIDKIITAAKLSNVFSDISKMPEGFNTQIGHQGKGLSQGQIQRILIARIFYKKPKLILIDEFTNSIDKLSEEIIMRNFNLEFHESTVVMVTHNPKMLATSQHIVALRDGKIIEWGDLEYLKSKGGYVNSILQA